MVYVSYPASIPPCFSSMPAKNVQTLFLHSVLDTFELRQPFRIHATISDEFWQNSAPGQRHKQRTCSLSDIIKHLGGCWTWWLENNRVGHQFWPFVHNPDQEEIYRVWIFAHAWLLRIQIILLLPFMLICLTCCIAAAQVQVWKLLGVRRLDRNSESENLPFAQRSVVQYQIKFWNISCVWVSRWKKIQETHECIS